MFDHETVIETVEDPISDGIFKAIAENYGEELPEYLTDTDTLDIGYYYQHSGSKLISPIVRHFLDNKMLTADGRAKIAKVILAAYKDSWKRVYEALTAEYSPIENVEEFYTETTERTGKTETSNTGTNSGTDKHAYTGSDTKTNTGTDTSAQSGTDTTTNTGTTTNAQTGTDTRTNTGTVKDAQTGTDTTTNTGTTTNAQTGTDTTTSTGTVTDKQSGTDTTTNTGTQESKNVNKDGTSETINGLAGFNSDEYNKDNKSTTTVNQTITDTRTDNLKSALEHGLTDTTTNDLTEATKYGRTDTQTDNTTQSVEHGLTDTTTNDLTEATKYGRTDTQTDNTTQSVEHGLKDTRTLDTTEKTVYNNNDDETINLTSTNSGTEDISGKDDVTRHRHGNIGVTTNQYMITEEMELRKKYFILNTLYGDVDKFMTIPIY